MARLAGLPKPVLVRAREILSNLEQGSQPGKAHRESGQASLFDPRVQDLAVRLGRLEPEKMTPLESLRVLDELSQEARTLVAPPKKSPS